MTILKESNEQRPITLENPNLYPKGLVMRFGFLKVNSLCSLNVHSNLVEGEYHILTINNFLFRH